jgi:hypothetical protein
MMKKATFYTILFLILTTQLKSQVFTHGNAVYKNLPTSIPLAKDSIWDNFTSLPEKFTQLSLGFTFDAFLDPFDTIWIDEGGIWSNDLNIYAGLWAN